MNPLYTFSPCFLLIHLTQGLLQCTTHISQSLSVSQSYPSLHNTSARYLNFTLNFQDGLACLPPTWLGCSKVSHSHTHSLTSELLHSQSQLTILPTLRAGNSDSMSERVMAGSYNFSFLYDAVMFILFVMISKSGESLDISDFKIAKWCLVSVASSDDVWTCEIQSAISAPLSPDVLLPWPQQLSLFQNSLPFSSNHNVLICLFFSNFKIIHIKR